MKHVLLISMLVSIGAAASAAGTTNENAIAQKLMQLPDVQKLKVREHVTLVGQSNDGKSCRLEISKDPGYDSIYGVKVINGRKDESVDITLENSARIIVFNQGAAEKLYKNTWGYESVGKTVDFSLKAEPQKLAVSRVDHQGSIGSKLNQIKIDLTQDGRILTVTGINGRRNPNINDPELKYENYVDQSSCKNLKSLGIRKSDYLAMFEMKDQIRKSEYSLLEYCQHEYSSICPDQVDHHKLPESLKQSNVCQAFEKAGLGNSEEAEFCRLAASYRD